LDRSEDRVLEVKQLDGLNDFGGRVVGTAEELTLAGQSICRSSEAPTAPRRARNSRAERLIARPKARASALCLALGLAGAASAGPAVAASTATMTTGAAKPRRFRIIAPTFGDRVDEPMRR
jgi:hypothetical protein